MNDMARDEFEKIAAEEWAQVPPRFKDLVRNVAVLIEDEPSEEVRKQEKLGPHDTLLGLYHGIPNTARGDWYGVGATLPDTITLYRVPILDEADYLMEQDGDRKPFAHYAHAAVRETIWHELGHYFGLDDDAIHEREHKGTNRF